jgi:hypothetical protein
MIAAILTLRQLALGVWLGALLMLGIAVAGRIFQLSPSKTLAGEINGVILGRMNTIEWVCGIIALFPSLSLVLLPNASRSLFERSIAVAGIGITLVLLWWYSSAITGRMTELRATIQDFDHPRADAAYVAAKEEFDSLHHRYTALVGINMIVILGEFVWGMVRVRS